MLGIDLKIKEKERLQTHEIPDENEFGNPTNPNKQVNTLKVSNSKGESKELIHQIPGLKREHLKIFKPLIDNPNPPKPN